MLAPWGQSAARLDLGGVPPLFLWCFLAALIFLVPWLAGLWKVFEKAGEPGWAALVPIYNLMVAARVGGKDAGFGLLCLLPVLQVVFLFLLCRDLARAFGKGTGFAFGLLVLPFLFFPMLGLGEANHLRNSSGKGGAS